MAVESVIASAVAENKGDVYATQLQAAHHVLVADEPVERGGKDMGPTPGDLMCMALASCKAITLRMYAQRKNWDAKNIKVTVSLVKGDDTATGKNTFHCTISVDGNLTAEQQERLLQIASKCPVDRLLTKESEVVTTM